MILSWNNLTNKILSVSSTNGFKNKPSFYLKITDAYFDAKHCKSKSFAVAYYYYYYDY